MHELIDITYSVLKFPASSGANNTNDIILTWDEDIEADVSDLCHTPPCVYTYGSTATAIVSQWVVQQVSQFR